MIDIKPDLLSCLSALSCPVFPAYPGTEEALPCAYLCIEDERDNTPDGAFVRFSVTVCAVSSASADALAAEAALLLAALGFSLASRGESRDPGGFFSVRAEYTGLILDGLVFGAS